MTKDRKGFTVISVVSHGNNSCLAGHPSVTFTTDLYRVRKGLKALIKNCTLPTDPTRKPCNGTQKNN